MAKRSARRGYGPRGTSYTEMKAKDFADMIRKDMGETIDADLNGFVRAVVDDLTSDGMKNGVSPVLTGFFASSWKADNNIIKKTDERKNEPEWAKIRTVKSRGKGLAKESRKEYQDRIRGSSSTVLAPGQKPLIKQRYPVEAKFTRNQKVYIGNATKYSSYALISRKSKIPDYLAGTSPGRSMKAKIDRFFSDKRPDIRIGGSSQIIPNTDPKKPERRTGYIKYPYQD